MRVVRLLPLGLLALGFALPARAQAQEAAKPPVMSHDAEGKDNCLMCHSGKMANIPGAPAESHKDLENGSCQLCHAADSPLQTASAPMMKHDLAGKEACLMCHSGKMASIPAAPHEGVDVKYCSLCHKPAK